MGRSNAKMPAPVIKSEIDTTKRSIRKDPLGRSGWINRLRRIRSLRVYSILRSAAICVNRPRIKSVPMMISAILTYHTKKSPKGK